MLVLWLPLSQVKTKTRELSDMPHCTKLDDIFFYLSINSIFKTQNYIHEAKTIEETFNH